MTYLIFKRTGAEVAKWQLEAAGATLEIDLQGDEGVG